jgi:hypothetical protein
MDFDTIRCVAGCPIVLSGSVFICPSSPQHRVPQHVRCTAYKTCILDCPAQVAMKGTFCTAASDMQGTNKTQDVLLPRENHMVPSYVSERGCLKCRSCLAANDVKHQLSFAFRQEEGAGRPVCVCVGTNVVLLICCRTHGEHPSPPPLSPQQV